MLTENEEELAIQQQPESLYLHESYHLCHLSDDSLWNIYFRV